MAEITDDYLRKTVQDELDRQEKSRYWLAELADERNICTKGMVYKWLTQEKKALTFEKAVNIAALVGIKITIETPGQKRKK